MLLNKKKKKKKIENKPINLSQSIRIYFFKEMKLPWKIYLHSIHISLKKKQEN